MEENMKLANLLLDTIRQKGLATNKLLIAAGISIRPFYMWLVGDQHPSPISVAKMRACLDYLQGC